MFSIQSINRLKTHRKYIFICIKVCFDWSFNNIWKQTWKLWSIHKLWFTITLWVYKPYISHSQTKPYTNSQSPIVNITRNGQALVIHTITQTRCLKNKQTQWSWDWLKVAQLFFSICWRLAWIYIYSEKFNFLMCF